MLRLLFNIVLDIHMNYAMSGNGDIGWRLQNRLYNNTQLNNLIELATNTDLLINIDKTKVMWINTEISNINIRFDILKLSQHQPVQVQMLPIE